jgi:hypothetical protein
LYSWLDFYSFPLFLLPHVQAFATETEVHRRARVVAEAEKEALNEFVVLMDKQLSKTRAGHKQLRADLKTAVEKAEGTKDALDKAIAAGTADAQNAKSDFNEHWPYQEERRSDMVKELRKARLRANTLSSSVAKLKKARDAKKEAKSSDKVE